MEEREDNGGLGSETIVQLRTLVSYFFFFNNYLYKILKYKTYHQLKIYEIKKKRKLG